MGDGVGAELGALLFAVTSEGRRIPANGFVAVSSLLGALILVPIVIFWLMRHPAQDWAAWREPFFLSGLAYLVIFPSWLAYLFWNKGIATIGATRAKFTPTSSPSPVGC